MPARKLQVEIIGDSKSLERAFGRASKQTGRFGSALGTFAKTGALALGAAGVGGALAVLKTGFDEAAESAQVMAQTGAVLKSTGGAAKVTAKQVESLAGSLSQLSGVDDEAIQAGENLLLTFTKVRNEAGRGNNVFNQATKATLNLSVAMGKDMSSSAILVGKALNDPIRGMSAMSRAGIQFTDAQKKTVTALVESGNAMGAQKIILAELETQFGGSAKAAGETLPGQLAKAKNAFAEVSGEIVSAALPSITKLLGGFSSLLVWSQANWPKVRDAVVGAVREAMPHLRNVWAFIAENIVPIFRRVAAVAAETWGNVAVVFREHGPEIRRILGRVGAVAKALGETLLFLAQNVVIPIIKPLFTTVLPIALGVAITAIDKTTAAIQAVISAVKWIGNNAGKIFTAAAKAIGAPLGAIRDAVSPVVDLLDRVVALMKRIIDLAGSVIDKIGKVAGVAGSIGGFVGGIFKREHGGPVTAGSPFLVGEAGPELFVPRMSGNIVPLAAGRGRGGGGDVHFHFGNYVGDKRELIDVVRTGLADFARRNPGALPGVA